MGALDQRLRDLIRDAGDRDIEPGGEEVSFGPAEIEMDFGIDRGLRGELDPGIFGGEAERAFETGRPAGSEQLFRVGPRPSCARRLPCSHLIVRAS